MDAAGHGGAGTLARMGGLCDSSKRVAAFAGRFAVVRNTGLQEGFVQFQWNVEKEQANVEKHGVDFMEASTVFGDPFERTVPDPDHSFGEARFLSLGASSSNRVLVVSYTERSENQIRIISARLASRRERRDYGPRA